MSAPPQCPFCTPTPDRVFYEGMLIRGLWDGFPVSDGHALLVTRQHVPTWFEATDAERSELMASVAIARRAIEASRQPDGFNIGVNVGTAAGQTVSHLHVHVIPRYSGDVPDPRGGVRWVLPSRANYLVARDAGADDRHGAAAMYGDLAEAAAMDLLSTGDEKPLWPLLANDLAGAQRLDIAVAFVMPTGVQRLYPYLEDHLARGGVIRLVTGDYLDVSDPDALQRLLDLQTVYSPERVALRVFVAGRRSFHPKSYILSDAPMPGMAARRTSAVRTCRTLHFWRASSGTIASSPLGTAEASIGSGRRSRPSSGMHVRVRWMPIGWLHIAAAESSRGSDTELMKAVLRELPRLGGSTDILA